VFSSVSEQYILSRIFHSAFKAECRTVCVANADAALAESEYDRAIELYSAAIDLDVGNDTLFAKRSKANLGRILWEEALVDARKVQYH